MAPEGITLVEDGGGVVGTARYGEVTGVSADRHGRKTLLTVHFADRGAWTECTCFRRALPPS